MVKILTVLISTCVQYLIHSYVSSFCKCKSISVYAIFNDQSFNDTLTNDIVSFEQLGPICYLLNLPTGW